MTLRIAFMGTPDFAVPTLRACLAAQYTIAAVYTQPPRPSGRGMALTPSPVHALAQSLGIEVRHPLSLKGAEAQSAFAALSLDVAVVVAYGLILPPVILSAPRLGCINVHASLLPRWRGAAPIQRAIEAGDTETGITIMAMDAGLDTGAMVMQARCPILATTTSAELHDQLAELGAQMLPRALEGLATGQLTPVPQGEQGITYAAKISKAEAEINWQSDAIAIARKIRALSPFPGAFTYLPDGTRLKLHRGEPIAGQGAPGEVLDDALAIACGQGALRLIEVQREGRAAQSAAAFLRGHRLQAGEHLGKPNHAAL